MTIPTEDAANALKDAEAAAGRSQAARGYQQSSLYLILWGVVWIVANVASQASAHAGIIAWNIGALVGVLGSVAIGLRQARANRRGGVAASLLIALAIGGFGAAASAILPALSFAQYGALACLSVGAIYMAMGARAEAGLRLSAVGAAVMVSTVLGWLFARDYFFLWMAAAGGGGLILGGLWFRKA